jgi:hypothetical protein
LVTVEERPLRRHPDDTIRGPAGSAGVEIGRDGATAAGDLPPARIRLAVLSQELYQSPVRDDVADAFDEPDVFRDPAGQRASQENGGQVKVLRTTVRG